MLPFEFFKDVPVVEGETHPLEMVLCFKNRQQLCEMLDFSYNRPFLKDFLKVYSRLSGFNREQQIYLVQKALQSDLLEVAQILQESWSLHAVGEKS